jgi:hypothetical protein
MVGSPLCHYHKTEGKKDEIFIFACFFICESIDIKDMEEKKKNLNE